MAAWRGDSSSAAVAAGTQGRWRIIVTLLAVTGLTRMSIWILLWCWVAWEASYYRMFGPGLLLVP